MPQPVFPGSLENSNTLVGQTLSQLEQIPKLNLLGAVRKSDVKVNLLVANPQIRVFNHLVPNWATI